MLKQIHKVTASEFVSERHYSAVMPSLTKYFLGYFVEDYHTPQTLSGKTGAGIGSFAGFGKGPLALGNVAMKGGFKAAGRKTTQQTLSNYISNLTKAQAANKKDIITVITPSGEKNFEIIEIKYI